jgi:hypothetical protein
MVLCDNCDVGWHTYCVGLPTVPAGNWYCPTCPQNGAVEPSPSNPGVSSNPRRTHRSVRTQAERAHARREDHSWAQVWQSVHDSTGLDLDFPNLDIPYNLSRSTRGSSRYTRRAARNNNQFWEERIPVAERQGGANPFSVAASSMFHDRPSRPRPERPEPESLEEQMAWNAFEKARDIETDPNSKSRKRKSTTSSPSDADPIRKRKKRKSATTSPIEFIPPQRVDRPLKRPQTRRVNRLQEAVQGVVSESSTPQSLHPATSIKRESMESASGPSFFQSLLKEVESSIKPEETTEKSHTSLSLVYDPSGHSSPRSLSPGASPTGSNHPSPAALSTTPPPYFTGRPGSPVPLTSKVEPIYPLPEFSPERSPPLEPSLPHSQGRFSSLVTEDTRPSRSAWQGMPESGRSRSHEASPTRLHMPLAVKEDIQKLMKGVLREPYRKNEISKEEYTEINMNVSRQLYEIYGDSAKLDEEAIETCQRKAMEWVTASIAVLHPATKS